MKKHFLLTALLVTACTVFSQSTQQINSLPGEQWWGGATALGTYMPFRSGADTFDLRKQNFNNQTSPLLVSNKGRAVWVDGPFRMQPVQGGLQVTPHRGTVDLKTYGSTLRDAYVGAMKAHFPPSDQIPPEEFFSRPVYNTWIELLYDQNQEDILKYARSIIDHGFPTGVLMIDDNWQNDYGDWDFRAARFPNPKLMVDSLHRMGFKVMVWVCPFVSPDSKKGRDLEKKGYFVRRKGTDEAAVVKWWNGYSFAYDLSNPEAYRYLKSEFTRLQTLYGIDGFKLDAGDPERYLQEDVDVYDGKSYDVEQTRLWAQLAGEFPLNELRACWQEGNRPNMQRLGDKPYSWNGVSQLVPDMIAAGLLGYAYTCPDMIGGGEYSSFYGVDPDKFNQELIVRSCQIHAMMPVMQFSVAPWRILSKENLNICRRYALWHQQLGSYLVELAHQSARTGEPMVRHMAYSFPGQGFELVNDQFMLGDKYLVAPVSSASRTRDVRLPKGKWRDDQGKTYRGGRTVKLNVPLDRLPWFENISR